MLIPRRTDIKRLNSKVYSKYLFLFPLKSYPRRKGKMKRDTTNLLNSQDSMHRKFNDKTCVVSLLKKGGGRGGSLSLEGKRNRTPSTPYNSVWMVVQVSIIEGGSHGWGRTGALCMRPSLLQKCTLISSPWIVQCFQVFFYGYHGPQSCHI